MIEIELIVGTMGLEAVLASKIPKYKKSLLDKAGRTLKEFRSGADTFADSNKPGRMPDEPFKLKDFDRLSEMLLAEQELVGVLEGISTWPSELQMPLMIQIADVKAYLAAQLPQQAVSGMFAGEFMDASDSDKFRFLTQANLADDVTRFIDLTNAGAITPVESALMRTLFPMTHDYLVIEVMDRVLSAVVDRRILRWEGSWRKPAISGLLGVPIMNFQDVMGYQTGVAEKAAGRPKGPGAIQLAQANLTNNQAMDVRTLDQSKL